jgi:hypothetical protein
MNHIVEVKNVSDAEISIRKAVFTSKIYDGIVTILTYFVITYIVLISSVLKDAEVIFGLSIALLLLTTINRVTQDYLHERKTLKKIIDLCVKGMPTDNWRHFAFMSDLINSNQA